VRASSLLLINRRAAAAGATVVVLAACAGTAPTSQTAALGREIARGSLTAADGHQLPCCAADSSGAHVTIVGGVLTFYASAHYADSVVTPAGWRPLACVQEVPSGAHVALNGLVTLPDGSTYLLLPCSAGTYGVALTQQLDYPDGSSRTNRVTLSSGAFNWERDTLTIVDSEVGGRFTASLSGATITVTAPGHQYRFVAVAIH